MTRNEVIALTLPKLILLCCILDFHLTEYMNIIIIEAIKDWYLNEMFS